MTTALPNMTWTFHGEFFDIASCALDRVRALKLVYDAVEEDMQRASDMPVDKVAQLSQKGADTFVDMTHQAIVAVVFSALSAEACINHYASENLSKTYLKQYLDKLELTAKWIVIPRIVTGKQFDPGSKLMQDLSWLVKLRNRFVHFKSRTIAHDKMLECPELVGYAEALRATETVRGLVDLLNKPNHAAEAD